MKFTCPLIVVEDMGISRKFYEEVLGQKVILDFGANITFAGDFSLQTRETWAEFISKREEDIKTEANNFELYFEEEDFDTFAASLRKMDVHYLHDVKEYPWGQRVIRIYDPDMHIIEIGESMAGVVKRFLALGLSVEETAQRTQHPVEFVLRQLK